MTFQKGRVALLVPIYGYLAYRVITGFGGWDWLVVVTVVGLLLVNAESFLPTGWGLLTSVPSLVVGATAALGLVLPSQFGAYAPPMETGIMLASPFLMFGWLAQDRISPGGAFVGYLLSLGEGIILLTVLKAPPAVPAGAPISAIVVGEIQLLLSQGKGILTLLLDANATPSLPLRDFLDPVFLLLGVLGALGILFPYLFPSDAHGQSFDDQLDQQSRIEMGAPVGWSGPDDTLPAPSIGSELGYGRSTIRATLPGVVPLAIAGAVGLVVAFLEVLIPQVLILPLLVGIGVALATAGIGLRSRGSLGTAPPIRPSNVPAAAGAPSSASVARITSR